jgi:hypothetical protein
MARQKMDKSLADQYLSLYNIIQRKIQKKNIVQRKQVSVVNMLNHNLPNITFCHTLLENRWRLWLELEQCLMNV